MVSVMECLIGGFLFFFPWNFCWKSGPLNVAGLFATMLALEFESGVNLMVTTDLRWLILWVMLK